MRPSGKIVLEAAIVFSLLVGAVGATMRLESKASLVEVAEIDKRVAVSESQLNEIKKQLDRIEMKLDARK